MGVAEMGMSQWGVPAAQGWPVRQMASQCKHDWDKPMESPESQNEMAYNPGSRATCWLQEGKPAGR